MEVRENPTAPRVGAVEDCHVSTHPPDPGSGSSDTPSRSLLPLNGGEWAVVGGATFISGFFVFGVAGRDLPLASYLLVLGGGALLASPIGLLMLAVAAVEASVGRAWASGFRRLAPAERGARQVVSRAGRYAGFLWLANGVALWFATLAAA